MDVDEAADDWESEEEEARPSKRSKKSAKPAVPKHQRAPGRDRMTAGISTAQQLKKATKIQRFAQRTPNRLAKAGEADRHVAAAKPKHLFSGKRGKGSASHR